VHTADTPRIARITLDGRHVRLVPLLMDHAAALLRAADEARSTYAYQTVAPDLTGMQAFVATALDEEARGTSLPFAVLDPAGAVIGTTRYMTIEWWRWPGAPPPPIPKGPDVLEIGWTWYAERVQRTAVNTESKLLLCTHAFEALGVRRITWKTDVRNERSRAAILRLGAKFDGVLRAHKVAADGGVRDTVFYSMLRVEWPTAKARLEARLSRG
jgi:N-acetyltransferase